MILFPPRVLGKFLGTIAAIAGLLTPLDAVSAMHRSDSGWMRFDYPAGWHVEMVDQTSFRYVENFELTPGGSAASDIGMLAFDPYFVLEEARQPSSVSEAEAFKAFIRARPGEQAARFSNETINGRDYFVARNTGGEFPTLYLGRATAEGLLLVAGLAGKSGNAAETRLLASLADSMRFERPPTVSSGPADAVRDWYRAMRRGDSEALDALSCGRARNLSTLIGVLTHGESARLSDVIVKAGMAFDTSELRFMTYRANDQFAVVRVAGLIRSPDGVLTPMYQHASGTGGSNMIAVNKEAGKWKVCEPLRGGSKR